MKGAMSAPLCSALVSFLTSDARRLASARCSVRLLKMEGWPGTTTFICNSFFQKKRQHKWGSGENVPVKLPPHERGRFVSSCVHADHVSRHGSVTLRWWRKLKLIKNTFQRNYNTVCVHVCQHVTNFIYFPSPSAVCKDPPLLQWISSLSDELINGKTAFFSQLITPRVHLNPSLIAVYVAPTSASPFCSCISRRRYHLLPHIHSTWHF